MTKTPSHLGEWLVGLRGAVPAVKVTAHWWNYAGAREQFIEFGMDYP